MSRKTHLDCAGCGRRWLWCHPGTNSDTKMPKAIVLCNGKTLSHLLAAISDPKDITSKRFVQTNKTWWHTPRSVRESSSQQTTALSNPTLGFITISRSSSSTNDFISTRRAIASSCIVWSRWFLASTETLRNNCALCNNIYKPRASTDIIWWGGLSPGNAQFPRNHTQEVRSEIHPVNVVSEEPGQTVNWMYGVKHPQMGLQR